METVVKVQAAQVAPDDSLDRDSFALEPSRPQVVSAVEPRAGKSQAVERVIVRHSDQIGELFAALAEAQCADGYGDIEKTQKARIKSRRDGGADYSYSYETLRDVLDATRPFLGRVGIGFSQFPFPGERFVTIRTMLVHKSGQWIYNDLSAVIPMPDPQAIGSGISYLRRYAAKSILGVAAEDEDDDGASASTAPKPQPAQRASAQQVPRPEPQAQAPQAASVEIPNRGVVVAVRPNGGGGLVKLDTGFVAGTQNADLYAHAARLAETDQRVELEVTPSADPKRFAPTLVRINLLHA